MKHINEYYEQLSSIDEYMMQASKFHSTNLNEYLSTKIQDPNGVEPAAQSNSKFAEPPMTLDDADEKMVPMKSIALRTKKRKECEEKMKAWHEGKRRENIKTCTDAKLIYYWDVCKQKGYEEQCNAIEAEANRRGYTMTKLK